MGNPDPKLWIASWTGLVKLVEVLEAEYPSGVADGRQLDDSVGTGFSTDVENNRWFSLKLMEVLGGEAMTDLSGGFPAVGDGRLRQLALSSKWDSLL